MDVNFTNFEGDIDTLCPFCNKPHRDHFVDAGTVDGQRCMHHQPCEEQMKSLGIEFAPKAARIPRLLRQLFVSRDR